MTRTNPLALVVVVLAASCARSAIPPVRYENRSPVLVVDDREHTPQPRERHKGELLMRYDSSVFQFIPRALAFTPAHRARNVNSMDEVPDSTWFINRIGARDMTVEEVRRGPNRGKGPDASGPWQVTGSKVGGFAVGFQIVDARGDKFIVKFDTPDAHEMESGADVIVQHFMWAAGYNVSENTIIYFRPEQLVLAPDATVADRLGNKRPMTEADLQYLLAHVARDPDGRYRGLASKRITGKVIGGVPQAGVRDDDPNDRVPHEYRRELRGLYALSAWLDSTDLKETNALDVWVEDPGRPGHHYVVHYLLDFGKALGAMGGIEGNPRAGFAHTIDFPAWGKSLVSFGLWIHPWDRLGRRPEIPGVGWFQSELYHPARWRTNHPFLPTEIADRFDNYWASKIIARFGPEHIRAVVEEGRYSDDRATEHVVKVLLERQEKTIRHWFERVAPLERWEVMERGGAFSLCFEDLWLSHGLGDAGGTRYEARTFDYGGHPAKPTTRAMGGASGKACLVGLRAHTAESGYTIVEIRVARGSGGPPPMYVHLARDTDGRLRPIGVWRE